MNNAQMMNGGMAMNGMNANMMSLPNGMNQNTAQAGRSAPEENNDQAIRQKLNTAIYDYLLRNEEWDVARAMIKSGSIKPSVESKKQKKANTSEDNDDDGPNEQDAKRPNDLPAAGDGFNKNNTTFLLEWYGMFWEMWFATKSSNPGLKHKSNANTAQYAALSAQHARQQADNRASTMRNHINNPAFQNAIMRNGGIAPEAQMRMAARQNAMRMNPAQANNMRNMMQQSPSMERAGTNEELNGQRVRTPSDGDNAPSPKRARMDAGNAFPQAGMVPNGRMPQMGNAMMAGQGGNMMIPPHMMQGNMTPQMAAAFAANQAGAMNNANANAANKKSTLAVYQQSMARDMRNTMSQIPNAPNMPSTPGGMDMAMNPQLGDFYAGSNPMPVDMRAQGMPGVPLPPGATGPNGVPGGNHALQDYQMQLMLLEQQNKKRLLMAKNENEGGPNGNYAAGMSPHESRTGPSPNPEQMKRDGSGPGARNSHSPMNFGMPGGEVLMKVEGGMAMPPNGAMRPVTGAGQPFAAMNLSPAHLEQMNRSAGQAGRPNGVVWPAGQPGSVPMTASNSQAPMQSGPNQRNNAMPPPTTIPNNNANNAARATSPAQSSTSISTPVTTNKANPKAKKETKGERKRAPKRSNTTTAATPGENATEPPQTPTSNVPQTPVVGQQPGSNTKTTPAAPGPNAANPNLSTPNQPVQNSAQVANMAPPNAQVAAPTMDEPPNLLSTIPGLDVGTTMEFNLDYNGESVLGDFNFDDYMTTENLGDFDVDAMNFGAYDSLEATNDA